MSTDLLAEESVLGAMLQDNAALQRVQPPLREHEFSDPQCRVIFGAITGLLGRGEPADEVTVLTELRARGRADVPADYLHGLAVSVPSASNIASYAEIVRERAGRRELIATIDRSRIIAVNAVSYRDALDSVRALLDDSPTLAFSPFTLLSAADVHALPPFRWRIHSVLPEQGFAAIFGATGSGKSFLALDAAAAVAEGRDWFGYRAKTGRVVYIALEGKAGVRQRIGAWERHHGRPFPAAVRFVLDAFRLTEDDDVLALAGAIDGAGGADVVIVDTMNRAAPGIDENNSYDMGRVIDCATNLLDKVGGLLLLVHHTGKDERRGLRGHSSLHAALDAAIEVTAEGGSREWRVYKAKDGAEGDPHPFRLTSVNLGTDEDGEPVRSCVVEPIVPESSHLKVVMERADAERAEAVVVAGFRKLLAQGTTPPTAPRRPTTCRSSWRPRGSPMASTAKRSPMR